MSFERFGWIVIWQDVKWLHPITPSFATDQMKFFPPQSNVWFLFSWIGFQISNRNRIQESTHTRIKANELKNSNQFLGTLLLGSLLPPVRLWHSDVFLKLFFQKVSVVSIFILLYFLIFGKTTFTSSDYWALYNLFRILVSHIVIKFHQVLNI